MDPEAVADAGSVLIWGSNTLVANRHFWPFVEAARAKGAPLIVVDPARTRTAVAADLHVALRPGTDGALALGLCRAVLDGGGADPRFLRDRTIGWDDFRASLEQWTVEHTADVCGIDPAVVQRAAELVAGRGPLAVKLGQGMQRHAGGGQAARVVSCLPAITGAFDQHGGGLVYSTSPAYTLDGYALRRPDLRPGPVRSLVMTKLGATLLDADPAVRALVVIGANPLVSNPDIGRVRQGLERADLFTVAVDLFPTETTAYADIVLPSTMQHEQLDMTESFAHLYLNWNEPAVRPPGECLAHTELFRRLAAVMADRDRAFADPLLQATDVELAEVALAAIPEISVARLRREGFVRLPGTEPYRPFAERFPTASGRFEFASERADADGHGRLPNFVPANEAAADPGVRYTLIARGSSDHVNSVFAGTDRVRRTASAPPIRIHPDDADRDGLVNDDRVEVSNERGRFVARVAVSDTGRPGLATISKGWWRQEVNATVREIDSDMGNGAVYHDNVVDIAKLPLAEPMFMKEPAR
jgi:anaerobic selenocysteine-containing dehydrogenase